MKTKFLLSALTASAVLAAPLITGKILRPDGTPISNVIVQLKSTLAKDTTDAFGVYTIETTPSSSSTPTALHIDKNIVISLKSYQLNLSLAKIVSVQAELYNAQGVLIQSLFAGRTNALKLNLPHATGVQYLHLRMDGQSKVYTLIEGNGEEQTLSLSHSHLGLGLTQKDTLLLSQGTKLIYQKPVSAGLEVIPDLKLGHKSIAGSYTGSDTLAVLTMSNSSQGFKDTVRTQGNRYAFDQWYELPQGKVYNSAEKWNAYIEIAGSTSPLFSFTEQDEFIQGPTVTARSSSSSLSSVPSSSSVSSSSRQISYGTLTDVRDGKSYKTVVIGTQEWMAENLNYGLTLASDQSPANPAQVEKFCPTDATSCDIYGGQYWWTEAMNLPPQCSSQDCSSQMTTQHQGACPAQWRVPTDADFKKLELAVGMPYADLDKVNIGGRGQSVVNQFYSLADGGTNDFGFNILHNGADFYWTATLLSPGDAYSRNFSLGSFIYRGTLRGNYGPSIDFKGFIRCIRDTGSVSSSSSSISSSSVAISFGSLTDARDSKVYKTVQIGTQNWMAENLNYVPLGADGNGAWCYGNSTDSCTKYGRLYNWVTTMNLSDTCNSKSCITQVQTVHQGICPVGWHLPSDAEWDTLNSYLGSNIAGIKMRVPTWIASTWKGDNSSGFSALPAGHQGYGSFYGVGEITDFWTNTEYDLYSSFSFGLRDLVPDLHRSYNSKVDGLSVRCIQN